LDVTYLQSPSSPRRSISPAFILLSSLIFLFALLPRLGAIDRYVTPDELHWVDRSIRFTDAITHGKWADTIQSGHPGATTMWLGSIGIALQRLINPANPLPYPSIAFDPQNADAMRGLARFLDAARLPVILVTSFNIALLFILLSRKIDRRAAFLAAGLIALDPFGVALGSILHVDSLLTTFCLVSIAALFIAIDHPHPTRWLIASGLLAGLAALSKSPAIVLGPTAFIILAINTWQQHRSFGSFVRSFFIWGICATIIFFALYPAMWVKPIAALGRMASTAEKFSEFAHAVNYFFGSLERNPGPWFYPVVIAFRSTPILWAGLIAVILLIFRARTPGKFVTLSNAKGLALPSETPALHASRQRGASVRRSAQHDSQANNNEKSLRAIALIYFLFAILFIGLIALGAKKLDRYVFPAMLALDIVGALGLAYAIGLIADRVSILSGEVNRKIHLGVEGRDLTQASRPSTAQRSFGSLFRSGCFYLFVIACFVIASIQFISVWPLTLRAYNPLLGGFDGATRALPAGGGESAEVARELAASPFASKVIAVSDIVGTAPFFPGKLAPNDEAGFARADYMLFNASDFQLTPDVPQNWIGAAPVLTFTVQSQNFAWLYPNQWLLNDQQRLIDQRQAGDALITDYAATLPTRSDDPTSVLPEDIGEAAAIEQLNRLAQSHSRIFFFHYTASREPTSILIMRLLDTFAIKLSEWSSPLGNGALYALPKNISFSATPTPLNANATFGDRARLAEANLVVSHAQPGQAIGLDTQWIASLPESQLALSLIDSQGHTWSQIDERVPASDSGNIQRNKRLTLPVQPVTPPGVYQLKLSVFDLNSGTPLNIRTSDNPFAGQEWTLGSITIDPAEIQIDPATRKPPIEIAADLNGLRAIGSDEPPDPIITGDPWTLSMEWSSGAEHLPELDIEWLLTANDQSAYSSTLPLNSYSTARWQKGDVLQSKYDFRFPITLADGQYDLKFKLIDHATGAAWNDQTMRLTPVHVSSRPRSFTIPPVQYPSETRFDSLAALLGANVFQADRALTVTLIWQATEITTTNYTAFVQILNGDQVVQQIDNWQIGGDAPTSAWAVGQIILDQYVFDVPASKYQVVVGMYNAANGQRLSAFDVAGRRWPQDRVIVIK
jgi:hypothetical protein